jgi:DNA repair exonuclease SbcCD ATPase subunit
VKRLLALGVFAWLAVTPATWAQQDLTREQVLAYVALTKADRARDRGEALPALAAYEEALTKYSAIKQRDPRWHPDVVQYRIQYCLQELDKLKTAKTPAAPPPAAEVPAVTPDPAPVTPTPDAPPAAAPVLDQDVQTLRAQVAELQAALAVTQRLVQVEQDYATVSAERDQLRARVAELEAAPRPPDRSEELRQAAEQHQQERDRLQAELDGVRKQVETLTGGTRCGGRGAG